MTVSELIRRLQEMPPHAVVLLVLHKSEIGMGYSIEAHTVTWEANHVLIESK